MDGEANVDDKHIIDTSIDDIIEETERWKSNRDMGDLMMLSVLASSEKGRRMLLNRTVEVAEMCPLLKKVVSDIPRPPIPRVDRPEPIVEPVKSTCFKVHLDPTYDGGFSCKVSGIVNTNPVAIEIDTGSWFSLMSLETWTNLLGKRESDIVPGKIELEAYKGGDLEGVGYGTIEVQFMDSTRKYPWRVAIIRCHRSEHDLLLGLDFLRHYEGTVSFGRSTLDFPPIDHSKRITDSSFTMPQGARPVLSYRETALHPGKGTAIQCRMDIRDWNSRDCEFEPSPTWGRDVMMPPALVDPKKGRFQLYIENYTSSLVTLPEGYILGWILPGTWVKGKILGSVSDPGQSLANYAAARSDHPDNGRGGAIRTPGTRLTTNWINRGKKRGRSSKSTPGSNEDHRRNGDPLKMNDPEAVATATEPFESKKGQRSNCQRATGVKKGRVAGSINISSVAGSRQRRPTSPASRALGTPELKGEPMGDPDSDRSDDRNPLQVDSAQRVSNSQVTTKASCKPRGGVKGSTRGVPQEFRILDHQVKNPEDHIRRPGLQEKPCLRNATPCPEVMGRSTGTAGTAYNQPPWADPVTSNNVKVMPEWDDDCDSEGEFPGTKREDPDKWPDSHLRQMLPDKGLTPEQYRKAEGLLEECKSAFVGPDNAVGYTDLVKHTIDIGDTKPIHDPPRRISFKQKEALDAELDSMLKGGKIVKSRSAWASPVVMVLKKDGSIRCCIDYRRLNEKTKRDSYPLPRIDDALDSLGGSKWFSTLDLASGYWQIAMAEEDVEKTAFCTHRGLFQWLVMPFGLCNAPATFERLMESILGDLQWHKCLVYLDDIIVFGDQFDLAFENLRQVFYRLIEAKLRLKPKKCFLFRNEVEYLGHVVTDEGIKPCPKKVAAVKEWKTPTTLKQVRGFLGLASYYRRFIPNFSELASPLTHLTKKDVPFEWQLSDYVDPRGRT